MPIPRAARVRPSFIEILEARIAPAAVAAIDLSSLDGKNGFKLSGVADGDWFGASVSTAGDVNGDGFADLIVGARNAGEGGEDRGASYVVFGQAGGFAASVALSALDGANGFKLSGVADGDLSGISVSAAGDVNGDSFADVIIGAPNAKEGGNRRGASYVVFGKAGGFDASVALSTLDGTDGFKLTGVADLSNSGISVSAAGDVNGDGLADLIIGATGAAEDGTDGGASYVVFGNAASFAPSVALSALDGSNGFKLTGVANGDFCGYSVSAAGDVNGDGFSDLIIGAPNADEGGSNRGASYVFFGTTGGFGATVALSALNGANGFKLSGVVDDDQSGISVSAAGDVNGDGFADLIVGAVGAAEGGNDRGASYVVFGKAGGFAPTVALSALDGSNGFKLSGVANVDLSGHSVSAAGDVNGDGFADLIIGAMGADEGGSTRGASYLVCGKAGGFTASVPLSAIDGANGFKLSGVADDNSGRSVKAAGDVNGDGFGDLIIGAPFAAGAAPDSGASYVVFGFGTADVNVATPGKSATFTDWDGDLVTIKSSKGLLTAGQFHLSSPNPLTGGAHLVFADFTDANLFTNSNLTFTAKRGPMGGDGLVNVGTIDARGVTLGKVNVDGDLQQLDAASIAGLTVDSLGQFAAADVHGAPLTSTIDGTLGALTVKTDASRVTLTAKTFGAVKALNLDDVQIFAAGVVNPATPATALAIKSLTVGGTVRDSQIFAGYDATGAAFNADVAIGGVKVAGQWVASNLVAGVRAGDDGIFATGDTNETLVAGGNAIVAKISGITIGGAAIGTLGDLRDGFGFTAEEIASLNLGKAAVPLTKGAGNDSTPQLLGVTSDVRVRETGTPGAPPAPIAGPAGPASFDLAGLDGKNGFTIRGESNADGTGYSVCMAGDVNGDGFDDVIVGAPFSGTQDRGSAYVIFGSAGASGAQLDLETLLLSTLDGINGFKLTGANEGDFAGWSVSAAGDVNGDGFGDVIVGAIGADEGGNNHGAAYVIFGKAGGFDANVDLGSLGGGDGFKLVGPNNFTDAAGSVSGAGDVNGDGFDDVIVGANMLDGGRGAAYVVFGKADGFAPSVGLGDLDGSNGFKLSGAANGGNAGYAVSAAGDVNGDGFDDVIVGANLVGTYRGEAYVVFGKAGGFGANVALGALDGSDGFTLSGGNDNDVAGHSVGGAGDVNGDGFDDLLIGALNADTNHGAAYVVFGKAAGFGASLMLGSLTGSDGFKLGGINDGDHAGASVSGAGDLNGDGFADLIVSASYAVEGGLIRGTTYVVFGKADSFGASVSLGSLNGSDGFKLPGLADNKPRRPVSGAGDVNGDGFDDLLIGAFSAGTIPSDTRGTAYVVYGSGTADVTVATDGKSATFIDWDGDLVTIKATKGPLDAAQFKLSSTNPLTGGAHLIYADFTAGAGFANANLTITAKRGPTGGDGLVNVGTIDARGVALGKVSIDGDLQQLDAAGVAGLTVYSLGQFVKADVHGGPLTSTIAGKLGALTVKTDASRVTVAAETIGAIKALNLDAVTVLASGVLNPAKAANALAIKSLTATGSVKASQILAGYDATGAALNADVQIGKVVIKGQWIASGLVAGATAGTDGLFGTADDALIAGGNAIVAKIAGITITGAAFGTLGNLRDGFGFTAEEIGALSIGKAKLPLEKDARNDLVPLLAGLTGDLRVREVA